MALITEERIRDLAGFKSDGAPVVSVYLDVDGRRTPKYADVEARLDRLVRPAVDRATKEGASAIAKDLERVVARLKSGLDRTATRGVAVFACGAKGLFELVELPVAVRDQVVVNTTPHVRQLELVLDQNERFGVLLTDRQRARMFVFELGRLVDRTELFEALPRHDDDAGGRDRGHDRGHVEAMARAHLKHAADVAFAVHQQQPLDHLIIGAPDDIARELERDLHTYLRNRIAARIGVPITASEATIRDAALQVEADVERDKDAAIVAKLRDAVGSRRGGVSGLTEVLQALTDRRVDTLVVSDGLQAAGWRCPSCNHVCAKVGAGRHCPMCDATMELHDDVVEDAIEEALLQSCRVRSCAGNADLDVMGGIGALLRY